MKALLSNTIFVAALAILCANTSRADNTIYGISTPGGQFAFTVDNIPAGTTYPTFNPTLILTAGATYQFNIQTTAFFHPVVIATNRFAFPPVSAGYSGASAQPQDSLPISVTIPASAISRRPAACRRFCYLDRPIPQCGRPPRRTYGCCDAAPIWGRSRSRRCDRRSPIPWQSRSDV